LQAAGCKALDDGDIVIPNYLPIIRSLQSGAGRARGLCGTASASVFSTICNSPVTFRC
jgi:hypothetical protein